MIDLGHLIATGEGFGIHCTTEDEVRVLIDHIYTNYPLKYNHRIDVFRVWDDYKDATVIYPNFNNCNKMSYGRLGGNASFKRKIYGFYELQAIEDLPIEQSDMDISLLFSEVIPC